GHCDLPNGARVDISLQGGAIQASTTCTAQAQAFRAILGPLRLKRERTRCDIFASFTLGKQDKSVRDLFKSVYPDADDEWLKKRAVDHTHIDLERPPK